MQEQFQVLCVFFGWHRESTRVTRPIGFPGASSCLLPVAGLLGSAWGVGGGEINKKKSSLGEFWIMVSNETVEDVDLFWADEFQSLLLMGVFGGEDDSTEDVL